MSLHKYVHSFEQAFAYELGEALYLHFFQLRKHYGKPMPDPEYLAVELSRWIVDKYTEQNTGE